MHTKAVRRRNTLLASLLFIICNWIMMAQNICKISTLFRNLQRLQISVRITRQLHRDSNSWALLIPFFMILTSIISQWSHRAYLMLQILVPNDGILTLQDSIWIAILHTTDDLLLWKASLLRPIDPDLKVQCKKNGLIIGLGDILIPSDLISISPDPFLSVIALFFGCLVLRINIGTDPVPALIYLVPPILLSIYFQGHLRLLTLLSVPKNVCACLIKFSLSSADFLRALLSMKKMRPFPVRRSS